ncbi:MAG: hypothetical protein QOJ52_791, partial [Acidimicrobiaceae bacterium]|nr:hypothetical protein [Acidimicrobiaceae bacterium]
PLLAAVAAGPARPQEPPALRRRHGRPGGNRVRGAHRAVPRRRAMERGLRADRGIPRCAHDRRAAGVGAPFGMASRATDRSVGVARGGVHRGGRADHAPGGRLALRWRLHPRGAGLGTGHLCRPERAKRPGAPAGGPAGSRARTSVLFDLPVARADLHGRRRLPGRALRRRSAGGGSEPRQRVLLLRDRTALPPTQAAAPGASRGQAGGRRGVDSGGERCRTRSGPGMATVAEP